jgi:hypothetical protein
MDIIEQNIRNLSDEELIRVVRIDFEQYTQEALFFARDEMNARNIQEAAPDEDEIAEDTGCNSSEHMRKLKQVELLSQGKETMLNVFLTNELQYLESCNAILDFVMSMSIRNGEYEGNVAIIKKMDFNNFILYAESIGENKFKSISGCVAIGRDELVEKIHEIARQNGVELEVKEVSEY